MSKRENESEITSQSCAKIRKLTINDVRAATKDATVQNVIIPMAVSYLDSIQDLKNCLLLSRTVRDVIFALPSVMKRIKFLFKNVKKEEVIEFIEARGYSIRFLDINVGWKFGKSMKFLLCKLSKLQELSLERLDCYDNDQVKLTADKNFAEDIADLSQLKILKVNRMDDLKDIIENSVKLTNLTAFFAKFTEDEDHEILTNFISQQNNLQELDLEASNDEFIFSGRDISGSLKFKLTRLKLTLQNINQEFLFALLKTQNSSLRELELEIDESDSLDFPSRDISMEVNLELKILKLSYPKVNQENFVEFLKTQSHCLEELELFWVGYQEVYEMILNNFKVLKKLTIDGAGSDALFHDDFPETEKLETLKYFHDKNQNGTLVSKLFKLFPNIEILKCCDTMQATGTYERLTTLDVSEVYWPRIRNLKMPNLKNLFIKKIDKCDDPYYWTHFTANFLNIENITVEKLGYEDKDVLRFVKRLKVFKKLKSFKLRHGNAIEHDYVLDENERVKKGEKFFKILVDTSKKTIKVSSYIARNCEEEIQILKETFEAFEFFEFCFEKIKIEKITFESI